MVVKQILVTLSIIIGTRSRLLTVKLHAQSSRLRDSFYSLLQTI